jgi:hypothetical protein
MPRERQATEEDLAQRPDLFIAFGKRLTPEVILAASDEQDDRAKLEEDVVDEQKDAE